MDASTLLLSLRDTRIIARGIDTRGQADGKVYPLVGLWRVAGTEKIGSRTYYVVEPAKAKQ